MRLSKVIRYPESNSVEATWVDDGGGQVRCHSYDQTQMDVLLSDLGADAPAYSGLVAEVLANPIPQQEQAPPSAADQIVSLEQQYLLPRITREFILGAAEQEASKQGVTPDQLYATNIGYRRVKDLDSQISALRGLL